MKFYFLFAFSLYTTTVDASLFTGSVHSAIKNGVEHWLAQSVLPDLSSPAIAPAASSLPLPLEVQSAFQKLHQPFFGNRNIQFRLFPYEGDVAFIHLESRAIYINTKIISALKQIVPAHQFSSILILILAHEIGHYIYEAQVQYSAQGTSFLNQGSYAYSRSLSSEIKARMHGEVDAIGLYLATKVGVDPMLGLKSVDMINQAILKNTNNMISLSRTEIDGRAEVIKDYLFNRN